MKELIDQLNPAQRAAVTTAGGPLLVLAGAGSGKTRVLTLRIAWLIEECGIAPWELLAVTFTNKAAGEMKERVSDLLGSKGRDVWVSTFHSTCLRILRREIDRIEGFSKDFVIYDDRDSRELVKRILKDGAYPQTINPRAIRAAIDRAKNEAKSPEALMKDPPPGMPPQAAEIYAIYQQRLKASNALDFGDLIYRTLWLLERDDDLLETWRGRFKHIMVDEYQDTNHVQYRLVRLLADHGDRNLCVVGDEDQSIYSFRGADIRNILDFERDFPGAKVVRLEQNYRSSDVILKAASAVVSHNSDRLGKVLWTDRTDGESIRLETAYDDREEARFAMDIVRREMSRGVQPRDIAIFYRTNGQSRLLEEELLSARVPFLIVGGQRFFDRREVKNVLAYLKLVVNPNDEMAFRRVVNEPPRGIGAKTVSRLGADSRALGGSLWDATVAAASGSSLSARARSALGGFRDLIEGLRKVARDEPLSALFEAIYERTGMIKRLQDEGTFEAEGRIEVLQELLGSAAEYAGAEPPSGLLMFLDRVSLVADTDDIPDEDDEGGKVTLMTVHSAKGLEFPVVLVVGMDEKTFPHARAVDFQAELEEERRLAYVAITRAEDRLYLLRARRRPGGRGRAYEPTLPSRFLRDIPRELLIGASDLAVRPIEAPRRPQQGPAVPGDSWVDYDTPRSTGSKPSRFSAAVARRQRSLLERRSEAERRKTAHEVAQKSTRFKAPVQGGLFGAPAAPKESSDPGPSTGSSSPTSSRRSRFSAPSSVSLSGPAGSSGAQEEPEQAEPEFEEPRVVYDAGFVDDEAATMIRPGTRVSHLDFGPGEVRKVEGAPGNRRVTIFFKRAGVRRLLLRNTSLEIVSH
ncbi:MAG: UvrD-helicase domain-containing protein [Deltaproteobacteria bacterium]|nr:UvrD-helicase domain-containing protein [Deltaproteobacteria bacterium]